MNDYLICKVLTITLHFAKRFSNFLRYYSCVINQKKKSELYSNLLICLQNKIASSYMSLVQSFKNYLISVVFFNKCQFIPRLAVVVGSTLCILHYRPIKGRTSHSISKATHFMLVYSNLLLKLA